MPVDKPWLHGALLFLKHQHVSLCFLGAQLLHSLPCLQLLSSSLRHLDISGNTVKNLQGVEHLHNLTWLDAGHNALQASGTHSL
jgi:Leucine-rich repeat (LRR) protein